MKLTVLSDKLLGEKLAVPIYNANGNLFLNRGTNITQIALKHLKNIGISTIYIEDTNSEVDLVEVLPSHIRVKVFKKLKYEFISIKKNKKINDEVIFEISDEIIGNINLSENSILYNNVGKKDEIEELVDHSLQVALTSIMIGANKQYNAEKLQNLLIGALLHDVGKLFSKQENHSEIGYRIIKENISFATTSCIILLQHHEHIDGTGFPNKLVGKQIYEFSQIVGIANEYINTFDEEVSVLPHEVMEKIAAQTLTRFCPEIHKFFTKSVYCYPNGLDVKLNTGESGTIIMQNKSHPLRPIIKTNANKFLNLLDNLTLFVEEVLL